LSLQLHILFSYIYLVPKTNSATIHSTLLFAAYSVAISANDSEYLAEICRDLAQSLVTEQGRMACEAQDEVLQVSDQLYINSRITENQLLYLRHLVLIREEAVATVYDDFQEHQSVPQLAKALYELCNTHPYKHVAQQGQGQGEDGNEEDDEGDEEDEDDEEEEEEEENNARGGNGNRNISDRSSPNANAKLGLAGVVSLMMRSKRLSSTESTILMELVRNENEYVLAAYELYESDRNIDELQDTLLRCAKLEVRKRMLDVQEEELGRMYQRERQRQYDAQEDVEDDDEEEDEEEEEDKRFSLEDIGLDAILESMDVTNIWESTVPADFVKIVFIAVIRKQLDVYQAKALCDLYHANYDLVRAAWEVYSVQEDLPDLLDTLRRVVKDLTVDTDDEDEGQGSDDDDADEDSEAQQPRSKSKVAPAPAPAAASASAPAHVAPASVATTQSAAHWAALDRKKEALAAVSSAKRDLLKHSLEMMVKQGITSAAAASSLLERYLQGDLLCEAAIDAYASDRNVAEFLDTLQILANHSPEELSEMMKDVSEEAEERAVGSSDTAANTRANAHISPTDKPAAAAAAARTTSTSTSTSTTSTGAGAEPTAQMQLRGIVTELGRNQMISAEVSAVLNKLIGQADRRLLLAYQRYLSTQEGAQLIDTMLRIAAAELTAAGSSPPKKQAPPQAEAEEEEEEDDDEDEDDEAATDGKESLLNASDQKTVIDILSRYVCFCFLRSVNWSYLNIYHII
jgi:ribosomal protein L12E/L44/L45/RPP1/RPP2